MDSGSLARLTATAPPGTYYVRVRARNACGTSPASNEIVIVVAGCATPTAPVGLSAGVNGSAVTLNWQAPGGTVSGYRVEVGSTPGASNLAQLEPGNVTGLTATAPNGTYHVRVRALSGCGGGDGGRRTGVEPRRYLA
jgi:predicted phage tail protein